MFGLAAFSLWTPQRWRAATLAAVASFFVLGLPTDVIPNPVFGRQGTPVEMWAYPVLVATAVLSGLLFATYVNTGAKDEEVDRPGALGSIGGMLSYFAIGCPICNKIVILAIGTSGALSWFAPIQPYLGVISLLLVGWALTTRLKGELSCPIDA